MIVLPGLFVYDWEKCDQNNNDKRRYGDDGQTTTDQADHEHREENNAEDKLCDVPGQFQTSYDDLPGNAKYKKQN